MESLRSRWWWNKKHYSSGATFSLGMLAMEKLLAAWSIKTLQEAINLYDHIKGSGKDFEDVRRYLLEVKGSHQAFRAKRNIKFTQVKKRLKNCPDCGRKMGLYPVNDSLESQVDKRYNSMWLCGTSCSGQGCWHEEYNTESVSEILNTLTR